MDTIINKTPQKETFSSKTARKEVLDRDEVLRQVKAMIAEIIGDDVAEIVGITEKSTFLRDLDMNSIQIVALAEKIRSKYGDRIDVIGWFAKRPVLTLIRMNVSDVVKLIVKGE
jgi:acyl carrier protein